VNRAEIVGFGATFGLALTLYLVTASAGLQLDDAAELTLCAREWSAAHPPGYPVWVMLAHFWQGCWGDSPYAMAAWSALCGALAAAVWQRAAVCWLRRLRPELADGVVVAAAVTAALVVAAGSAVWAWANSVEVYALQGLATAMVVRGAAGDWPSRSAGWWVGCGVGLGLANHHLAMGVLVPFVPGMVAVAAGVGWRAALRLLVPAAVIACCWMVVAYGLLMGRAAAEVGYSFGQPSTLGRLWHHLRGGFFGELVLAEGVDYGGRVALYGEVLWRALWLGWLPWLVGFAWAWRRARGLVVAWLGFPLLLVGLQLGRAYIPNMDATVAPALQLGTVPVALGVVGVVARWRWCRGWLGLALVVVSLVGNWSAADRRGYAPGDDLLARLDASLPPRAILLAASWEVQTVPLLARDRSGWRPDVDVLAGSIKGPNAPLFARRWPELHAAVQGEYERYLAAIAAVAPDYVHTDWFQFQDQGTWSAYAALVQKVFAVARAAGRPVLLDKPMVALLLESKALTQQQVSACGCLFAVGEVAEPRPFPALGGWLAHAFVRHDLCAYGSLFDLQGLAPQVAGYWRARGRPELAAAAEQAARQLTAVWEVYRGRVPAPRRRVR
jgi:hypothetical protein